MTISKISQPEVELVNTRIPNQHEETREQESMDLDSSSQTNDITGESMLHINGNGSLSWPERVANCVSLCEKLQQSKLFEKDRVPFQPISSTRASNKPSSKTTIGLVLRGCVISELVPGGPAQISGELQPGDRICKINGQEVSDDIISSLLIGDDTPESRLVLTVCGKQGSEAGHKDVELLRAPSGAIGDRVRLFELFAAQKERALVEERARLLAYQVQCQSWLDNLHGNLVDIQRRSADEERTQYRNEGGSNESNEDVQQLQERLTTAEQAQEQNLKVIYELREELNEAKKAEQGLRHTIEEGNRHRQSLQSALVDLKLTLKTSDSSVQGQSAGLGELFVATKIELDKTRSALKTSERECESRKASQREVEEEAAALKAENQRMQQQLSGLMTREAEFKKALLDSADNLQKMQSEIEIERKRAGEEFRISLNKDVTIAKMRDEIAELRQKSSGVIQLQNSSSSEVYAAELTELSQRCWSLQNDMNSVLMLHNRLYEAICQTSKVKPCGIGVRLRAVVDASGNNVAVVIDSIFEGGPSDRSGQILAGDTLVKIDGYIIQGLTMDEVRRRIVGLPGTTVLLQVSRGKFAELYDVELTRSSGIQESLSSLEEYTTEACALATALYVSLDQAKILLQEAASEKEALGQAFWRREQELMKTVANWAEQVRNKQLVKSFESWVQAVVLEVSHKRQQYIIRKRITSNVVAFVFQQLKDLLSRRRRCGHVRDILVRKEKTTAFKKLLTWREVCINSHRNRAKAACRAKWHTGNTLVLNFQKWTAFTRERVENIFSVKRNALLYTYIETSRAKRLKKCLCCWNASASSEGYIRWKGLNAQKSRVRTALAEVLMAWKEFSGRCVVVRSRAGRVLSRSLRRSCHEYLLAWNSIKHLKSYLYQVAERAARVMPRFDKVWAFNNLRNAVSHKKRSSRAEEKLKSLVRHHCHTLPFYSWMESTKLISHACQIVERYFCRHPNEVLLSAFDQWQKRAHLKKLSESNQKFRAQEHAYCESETVLVKQVAQTSEKAASLQNELADESRKLAVELKKNSEHELALANAREEIAAYSQQVEYLRMQVREAWAASDAARADLSAAIKSSDQMRNALFGRHEVDGTNRTPSPSDAGSTVKGLRTSGIAVSSPSPLKRLDSPGFADA